MKKLITVILVLSVITALFTYAASALRLDGRSDSLNISTDDSSDEQTDDIAELSIEDRAFSNSGCLSDDADGNSLRTESINTSGPILYRFDSKVELDNFVQKHDPSSYGYDEVPSAMSVLENCDDTFFANYALMLIYLESSGSFRFDITGATYNKVTKTLDITEICTVNPEEQTDDIEGWFLTLPVLKSEIEGCVRYTVNGIGDGHSTDEIKVIRINEQGRYHSCRLSDEIFAESLVEGGHALYRFDSEAELKAFFQKYAPSSTLEGTAAPATNMLDYYTEAVLSNWSLFVIYIESPSSCRFRISGATYNTATKTLNINAEETCQPDDEHTADECGYFLTLGVYKGNIEDCLYYTVNVIGDAPSDNDSSEDGGYEDIFWDDIEPGWVVNDCPEELVPESNHNYPNDIDYTWVLKCSGADSITAIFSYSSALANDDDAVYIYDGNNELIETLTSADIASHWASVDGDTMKIRLVSDGANTAYGFSFSELMGEFNMFTSDDDGYDKYLASVWSVELPEDYVADSSSEDDSSEETTDDSYLTVEDNLLLDKDYTVETDATANKADSGNQVTDGAIRGDKNNAWNGDLAVNGVSVEWFGTSKTITYTFTFDKATDVNEIVFKGVRIASNRAFGTIVVNDTNIVMSGQWTKTAVAGAPLYGQDGDATEQYFDISVAVDLRGITKLKIAIITDMYVCQYDEIMAFGPAVEEPSEDVPSEEPSEDVPSEEPSEDVPSEDPSEDIPSEDPSEDIPSEGTSSDDESSDDVADVVYGDANGDGTVNSLDAAQSLKHDANLITLDSDALIKADVNGDGALNSLDAAQILKYDANLISAFAVDSANN